MRGWLIGSLALLLVLTFVAAQAMAGVTGS